MHAWPTISSLLLTMGCTSSAPNMADTQGNTTEHTEVNAIETIDKQLNENSKDVNSENVINKFEVLPTCDNLDENIQQLDRKNSSKSVSNHQIENDDRQDTTINNENELPTVDTEHNEEKFSSLKDVVDQVILENILEDIQKTSNDTVNEIDVDENTVPVKTEEVVETKDHVNEDLKENVQKEEEMAEESASPSQSECSRSTRWEALADIAAELPASLAVDPLTGQIYSLTK